MFACSMASNRPPNPLHLKCIVRNDAISDHAVTDRNTDDVDPWRPINLRFGRNTFHGEPSFLQHVDIFAPSRGFSLPLQTNR